MEALNLKALLGIIFVFIGCSVNVVFLELLVVEDPGSGNLITFSQFLIIALEGFIITMRCGTKKPKVPISEYVVLVTCFFLVSTTNNIAFNFNISMTLHLIYRSGSLMANMVLGMIIMHKRYSFTKYLSVMMISIGITVATIASGKSMQESSSPVPDDGFSDYFWWICGISILTFALFLSARMGLYQEIMHVKYGKNARESLFFSHCLPLPGFLFLTTDLLAHIEIANNSRPLELLGVHIPCIWVYIFGNVVTQCVCINSVFVLTTECSSLTVTLVVTLRKFLSLIFSIFYFNNAFTLAHWFGTFCVFFGTLLYSDIPALIQQSQQYKKVKSS